VASGGVSPVEFPPLAVVALLAGSFTGYSWARVVGPVQLRTVAERLRAGGPYQRALRRAGEASPVQLMGARLLPGIRVYVSLAAGAGQMTRARFLAGNVPAVLLWAALTMGAGFVFGIPVIHFLGYLQHLALSGAVFIALGFFAWRAVRRAPASLDPLQPGPLAAVGKRSRYVLAAALDFGIVTTLAVGVDLLVVSFLGGAAIPYLPVEGISEPLAIVGAMALSYAVLSRRSGRGRTAGERLLDVRYHRAHPRRRGHGPGSRADPTGPEVATGSPGAEPAGNRERSPRASSR
jgi:membrane protein DedA with SNARE-associated domain